MEKYTRLAVALMAGCCMLQAGQALATPTSVYYPDTPNSVTAFPGFEDTGGIYQSVDSIGNNPDAVGMVVTYDNTTGQLLSITIESNTAMDTNGTWGFTSLFLNTSGAGQDWDYLVHSGGNTNSGFVVGNMDYSNGIYKVNDPSSYTYTYVTENTVNGSVGRADHPNGIDENDLTYQGALTPTYQTGVTDGYVSNGYTLTYDFSSLDITLGTEYTIGWTPFCANDVLYAQGKWIGPGATVPEPATMVFFGAGMAALAGWRIRKKTPNNK